MKKVKNLSIIKVDIFSFSFFSLKRIELLVKSRQKDKESDSPDKYIKNPILEEILTSFRVFNQRRYKNN